MAFLQIVAFLVIAAALGFAAVGWLVRGTRFQSESARQAGDWQTRLGQADERDRLRAELAAARAHSDASRSAAAGDAELAERAARLQRELEAARRRTPSSAPGTRPRSAASKPASPSWRRPRSRSIRRLRPPPRRSMAGRAPWMWSGAAVAAATPGRPDDLRPTSGIGPGSRKTCMSSASTHFHQIAGFTPENVAWVDRRLRFKAASSARTGSARRASSRPKARRSGGEDPRRWEDWLDQAGARAAH